MPILDWILGSVLMPSGWRLEVLFVRVTRLAETLFVGLTWQLLPPRASLPERQTFDADFEVFDVAEAA